VSNLNAIRRRQPCNSCGTSTRTVTGLCLDCQNRAPSPSTLDSRGWVRHGLVYVHKDAINGFSTYRVSEGHETMGEGHRRKSALTGAATPDGQGLAARKGHRPTHG
jgi:hypothetical protein